MWGLGFGVWGLGFEGFRVLGVRVSRCFLGWKQRLVHRTGVGVSCGITVVPGTAQVLFQNKKPEGL